MELLTGDPVLPVLSIPKYTDILSPSQHMEGNCACRLVTPCIILFTLQIGRIYQFCKTAPGSHCDKLVIYDVTRAMYPFNLYKGYLLLDFS